MFITIYAKSVGRQIPIFVYYSMYSSQLAVGLEVPLLVSRVRIGTP